MKTLLTKKMVNWTLLFSLLLLLPSFMFAGAKEDALKECLQLCRNFVWPLDAACQLGCSAAYLVDKATCPSPVTARFENSGYNGSEIILFEPGQVFPLRVGAWDFQADSYFPEHPEIMDVNLFVVPLQEFYDAPTFDDIQWQSLPVNDYDGIFWTTIVDPSLLPPDTGYAFYAEMNTQNFGPIHGFTIANMQTTANGNFYYGNLHTSTGNAQLQTNSDGNLTVSNIGSSGDDGVTIDLGEVDGIDYSFDSFPFPLNGHLQIDQVAFSGSNQGPISSTQATQVAEDEYLIEANFPGIDPANIIINAYQGDNLVYSTRGINSFRYFGWWPFCGITWRWRCYRILWWRWYYPEYCYRSWWPWYWYPNHYYLINGQQIQADMITVHAETDQAADGTVFSQVTASGIPEIGFEGEQLCIAGNGYQASGGVEMDASSGGLVVSNIGSSGDDGVSIDLGDKATGFGLDVEPTSNNGLYDLDFTPINTVPVVVNINSAQGGNELNIFPEIELDNPQYAFTVSKNGIEEYTLSDQIGSSASLAASFLPKIRFTAGTRVKPDGSIVFEICIQFSLTSITLPDGSVIEGDMLIIRPDGLLESDVISGFNFQIASPTSYEFSNLTSNSKDDDKLETLKNCIAICKELPRAQRTRCMELCLDQFQNAMAECQEKSAYPAPDPITGSPLIEYIPDLPFTLQASIYDYENNLLMNPDYLHQLHFAFMPLDEYWNDPLGGQWQDIGYGQLGGNGLFETQFDPTIAFSEDGYAIRVKTISIEREASEAITFALPRQNGISPIFILEGPFELSRGIMDVDLMDQGLIPELEPYSDLGYPIISPRIPPFDFLDLGVPTPLVDWVLIELRDAADPSIVVDSRTGILLDDGRVVDQDGRSAITFEAPLFQKNKTASSLYYVAIRHRNHLGVMTNTPVSVDPSHPVIDFRDTSVHAYPDAIIEVFPGMYAAKSGDTDWSATIDGQDRSNAWNDKNETGYLSTDVNMDGVVDSEDRSAAWNNKNSASF